jgi:hypothetical protein
MYYFYCLKKDGNGWKHVTPRMASIHNIPKWAKCETCGKRASLGLAPGGVTTGAVKNLPLDRKQRELYRHVFGKKKAAKMRTTADVEANLYDFTSRYPHLAPGYKRGKSYDMNSMKDLRELGIPGDRLRDPFPDTSITEEKRNHMSDGSRR